MTKKTWKASGDGTTSRPLPMTTTNQPQSQYRLDTEPRGGVRGVTMNDVTTIKLGIGLGNLRFGLTRDEVEAYLGQPDRIKSDPEPGAYTMWFYDSIGVYIPFDDDDDLRFGSIETSSPSATLNGFTLIGKTKDEVMSFIESNISGSYEEERGDLEDDGDSRGCELSFSSQSLTLWFEDDILTEIQWAYLTDDNGQVVWP